jgi:hypothetical protein
MRSFNLATILFVLTVAAFMGAACVRLDPRANALHITKRCHVGLTHWREGPRIVLFNDAQSGPYTGSIISMVGDPRPPTCTGFGDTAGIYIRIIRWPNGGSLWTVAVTLWYPVALAGIWPGIRFVRGLLRNSPTRRGFSVNLTKPA